MANFVNPFKKLGCRKLIEVNDCIVLAKSEWKLEKLAVCESSKLDCDHEKQSRKKRDLT